MLLLIPIILLFTLVVRKFVINQYKWYECAVIYKTMQQNGLEVPYINKFDDPHVLFRYLSAVKWYDRVFDVVARLLRSVLGTSEKIDRLKEYSSEIYKVFYDAAQLNDDKLMDEMLTTSIGVAGIIAKMMRSDLCVNTLVSKIDDVDCANREKNTISDRLLYIYIKTYVKTINPTEYSTFEHCGC